MPNGTTTAVQHPPKAHLGLPTTSWLGPSSFDKPSCPYVGQSSCPTNRCQSHHDLRSIMATDCAILGMLYSSHALTDSASSKTRTARHTSNCACNLRKTHHTRNVYSSTIAASKTTASTPDKLCAHTALAMNRPLWLCQAL